MEMNFIQEREKIQMGNKIVNSEKKMQGQLMFMITNDKLII